MSDLREGEGLSSNETRRPTAAAPSSSEIYFEFRDVCKSFDDRVILNRYRLAKEIDLGRLADVRAIVFWLLPTAFALPP